MKVLNLDGLNQYNDIINGKINSKSNNGHTHNYAGSSSPGGAATSALQCTGNSATATNADMVDGLHAWQMQTLDANGNVHSSNDWLMQVRHNVDGDGYFKLFCGNGSIGTKVDMAHASNYSTQATNADTLDSYHGNNYFFAYNNYGAYYFGSFDLNTWTRTGCYAIQSGCTNSPFGNGDAWGTLFVMQGLADRVTQFAIMWNEQGYPLWYRSLNGSSWSNWNKVYGSQNITYGTSVLTPGSSGLATGSIYLQYE